MAEPKVLILMADYGHDPTETAIPYTIFKSSGFIVHFATEKGVAPKCDSKMLYGLTQKLLVRILSCPNPSTLSQTHLTMPKTPHPN